MNFTEFKGIELENIDAADKRNSILWRENKSHNK
jgi:hypothetical protein